MRFPETPKAFIMITANNMDSGITEATISPARRLPRKITRMKTTISAPSNRFFSTVLMALFTIFVLSRKGSILTPSGNVFSICSILCFTSLITADELAPFNIITIAPATSPSSLKHMAPYLTALPMRTSATSFIYTGIPDAVCFTNIFPISSNPVARPSLRIYKTVAPFSI